MTPQPAPFSEAWALGIADQAMEALRRAAEAVLTIDMGLQLAVIAACLAVSFVVRKPVRAALTRALDRKSVV